MSELVLTVQKNRARKSELRGAPINSDPGLSRSTVMQEPDGKQVFLPVYRSALRGLGGAQAFSPALEEDGNLTFYLEAVAPPAIAAQVAQARPYLLDTTFLLVLNPAGPATRIPFASAKPGSNNIVQLSVKLDAAQRKRVHAALLDVEPNVAIEVVQSLNLATPLTEKFVTQNWANPTVRQALLETFHIPFDSASTFYMMAQQADPDYGNQYLIAGCTYRDQISAPPLPGYLRWQVDWLGRAYNYYQDSREKSRVFYLPDRFELAKGPAGTPSVSLLQFTLPEGQSSVDRTQATFRTYGRAVVETGRIDHAATALAARIGSLPQMISLQDAHGVKTTLTQVLPNASASGSNQVLQKNASIDLRSGVRNEVTMNFVQFRALWAAIFSESAENPLFRAWIDIEFLEGRYTERIPFDGRLPKNQESAFFDDILDTSAEITYATPMTVKTFKTVFEGAPEKQALELAVLFGPASAATLTAQTLQADLMVQRTVRDIVLGNQNPDEYRYRLRIVRADGTMTCCNASVKSDEPSLWILPAQVAQCTGDCA